MLAMMAMVVVPTSCGDDDDDDEKKENNNENNNDSNSSSNSIVGKVFVHESESLIQILVFNDKVANFYYCENMFNQYEEGLNSDSFEILSSGLISWDHDSYKYENGTLLELYKGEYEEWAKEVNTTKTPEELISEWKSSHPLK